MQPDDLTITTGGFDVTGWTDVRVTRGIERLPSDFNIGMTELYAGEFHRLILPPGATCQVRLGQDPVVTGYIDHYVPNISVLQFHYL